MAKRIKFDNPYEALKKCKKPVLIIVVDICEIKQINRIRLLDPIENTMEYDYFHDSSDRLNESCFYNCKISWKSNIKRMENWDKNFLKIIEIIEL